jgi:DNA-binding response OmpR family regulator
MVTSTMTDARPRAAAGNRSLEMDPLGRVLVVDDEVPLAKVVASYLEREGFTVDLAHDGPTAVDRARSLRPDLIVLDLMLPGFDGVEACRQIRTFTDAYVIMLTARDDETDKVVALSVGADDYIVKPFSPRELIARTKAMLRRPRTPSEPAPQPTYVVGGLTVDPDARTVVVDGAPVELTRTEFDILAALAARPKSALTRVQIIEHVWGGEWFGDEHVVDVHVGHLRRKLGDDAAEPRFVRTVRGVGYGMGPG